MNKTTTTLIKKKQNSWLKRMGVVGFSFFLIKGIIWLVAMWAGFSFL